MAKGVQQKPGNNVIKEVVRTVVKEELTGVEKRLDQKWEHRFRAFEERLDEKLDNTFRKYRDEIMTRFDQVMVELKTIREEQVGHLGQHNRLTDLPDRVETLEAIHPHGQHPGL